MFQIKPAWSLGRKELGFSALFLCKTLGIPHLKLQVFSKNHLSKIAEFCQWVTSAMLQGQSLSKDTKYIDKCSYNTLVYLGENSNTFRFWENVWL